MQVDPLGRQEEAKKEGSCSRRGGWQVVSKGLAYQAGLGRLPTRARSPYTVLNEAWCAYHPDDLSNTSPSQGYIPETAPAVGTAGALIAQGWLSGQLGGHILLMTSYDVKRSISTAKY